MNNQQFFANAYNENRNKWMQADGYGNSAGPQGTLPFILQITNNNAGDVTNIDIGDAYTVRTLSNSANFMLPAGVTITSSISGTSYQEFLAQSESKPFTVGKTMIVSTSAGQLDQTVAITHRNASGDRQDHVITPTLDPYQSQTDRIIDEYEYLFDGMTRLRFSQINAGATVTVRLYAKNMFSATQIIAGRPEELTYNDPNLIKAAKVFLG